MISFAICIAGVYIAFTAIVWGLYLQIAADEDGPALMVLGLLLALWGGATVALFEYLSAGWSP